jgi:phosphoribosyl 1,2-cyclic phosphodiesterase
MINVKCLASGSTGNSYAIDDGESVLLLEAGIPAKRMMSGYIDLLPRVTGCVITHEHMDHAKGAAGIAAKGIDLYATAGTFDGINGIDRPYRKHVVRIGEQFDISNWIVMPFETKHDCNEPCGYLIYSKTIKEKLLFATDTFYIPNTFKDLDIIMVECNYSLPILNESIAEGRVPESMKPRLLRSHFSLENVKEFLSKNNMSTVRHIYLIHLSGNNSNPAEFKKMIQRQTNGKVIVTVF